MSHSSRVILVCAALAAATLVLYWPVRGYEFVNLDDPDNVSRNALVYDGLTLSGLRTAMKTSDPDYWRPLTWVSFMIDTEISGARADKSMVVGVEKEIPPQQASQYHLTNVILHTLGALLLLGAMNALTGAFWRSAMVAAVFALHPLRVESVAWITERKDVLSGIFAFGSMWTYAIYVRTAGQHRDQFTKWMWMAFTAALLALGLMSKSTLVTWPCVFLLLDIWPLNRLDWSANWSTISVKMLQLVLEKIPLFAVSIGSCLMTWLGGSRSVAHLSIRLRVANSVMSYVRYVGKMFWPADLAVYYPYPGMGGADPWRLWQVISALAALVLITIAALKVFRKRRYVLVGWLWFVGMLVPVIGLLQVGNQGLADRFTYLPGIGLTIIVIWCVSDFFSPYRWGRWALGLIASAAMVACMVYTRNYLASFRNSDALYSRALEVTQQNRAVHVYYGDYLFHLNRFDEALKQFQQAAELTPQDSMPPFKLGHIYAGMRKYYEAQQQFEKAIALDPTYADAYFNLAVMLVRRSQPEAARPYLEKALQLSPKSAEQYNQLKTEMQSGSREPTVAPAAGRTSHD